MVEKLIQHFKEIINIQNNKDCIKGHNELAI